MEDISIEVNEINVMRVENMEDISIEVNEINVVSVENMEDMLVLKWMRLMSWGSRQYGRY